jgi:hypothetical protein
MVVITLDRIYKKEGVTWKVLWREWVKMSMVNMHHKSAWDLDENFKGCDYPTGFVLFIEDCVSALLQGTLQT